MELKDLQSDLEALRSLYGLLQCGENVASNGVLGERSKLLLKDILDGATERVLETHKMIIAAAEDGVCGTSCSPESVNCRAMPDFQASVTPQGLKAAAGLIQNFTKENNHTSSSQKDEYSPNKLRTTEVVSEQSRQSFSLDNPENRKKSCEFGKQSTMKQHGLTRILSKDSKHQGQQCHPLGHFYQGSEDGRKLLDRDEKGMKLVKRNETIRQSSIHRFQGTPSIAGSVVGSSRSLASRDDLANQDEKRVEAESKFSKDVDKVVKHIESHISALRLCSKLAGTTRGDVQHSLLNMPMTASPTAQAKEYSAKRSELSYGVESFSHRNDLFSLRLESQRIGKKDGSDGIQQVVGQSENDMTDDITCKRRRIQHKEVGQSFKHTIRRNDSLNIMGVNQNVNSMVKSGDDKQSQTTGCYVHGLRIPIKQHDITTRPPIPVKKPSPIPMRNSRKELIPRIAKLRPSTLSQSAGSKASVKLSSNKKSPVYQFQAEQKDGRMGILGNNILLHQQESGGSSTAGSDSSDSLAYSLPSEESAGSVTGGLSHGSYEDSRSSTSSDYRDASESSRLYSTRTQKAIRQAKSEPEKAEGRLGRLRRFKNKLGLIFHHHHHHHHHRYDHGNKGEGTNSMWTHLHKVFHPRTIREAQDKLRKGRVGNVPVKHQAGHFHALVQGLMQHLRHSKKSKPSKGGIYGHNGHKNRRVKQLHWWQKFQRQGVKLPNKKRVKIGFMSKKQQLRLPELK